MSDIRISRDGEPDLISASNGSLTVSLPIKLIRRGKCKAVTLPDGTTVQPRPWDDTPTPIQQALARGHRWLGMLQSGQAKSLTEHLCGAAGPTAHPDMMKAPRCCHRGASFINPLYQLYH